VETTRRSVAKALSWRFLASAITGLIVFVVTGELEYAAGIGLADTVIKLVVYVGHERLWNNISYGRVDKQPEYYI
jgi:uncharacterized membrane protein